MTDREAQALCEHDAALKCGCWLDDNGNIQRHAFRFIPGDTVRHALWKGFIGKVVDQLVTGRYIVDWKTIGGAAPSRYQSNFDITHVEVGA